MVEEVVRTDDLYCFCLDAGIVTGALDLDIAEESGFLHSFQGRIEGRNAGRRVIQARFVAEPHTRIKLPDLVIGDIPDLCMISRRAVEGIVVQEDDLAVLRHLHVKFDRLDADICRSKQRFDRILRRSCGITAVRHHHGQTQAGIE